jgi:hypothetical protein
MKAFRGEPSLFQAPAEADRRADLDVEGLSLAFGGVQALQDVSSRPGRANSWP